MRGMSAGVALRELQGLREWMADRLASMPARATRCETMEASARVGDEAFKFERWIEALDQLAGRSGSKGTFPTKEEIHRARPRRTGEPLKGATE